MDFMYPKYWTIPTRSAQIVLAFRLFLFAGFLVNEMRTRTDLRCSLRTEATDSQASLLQQRVAEVNAAVAYQEEQHGPTLVVCLEFRPEQERAVGRILEDVGLAVGGNDSSSA